VAAYLLDSSAAVKLYVAERGSGWLIALADSTLAHELFIIRITAVEIAAALYRRARTGALTIAQTTTTVSALRRGVASTYRVIEVSPVLLDQALIVAERRGLRGYDCVQLARALLTHEARLTAGLSALILVSADAELNAAATFEGLSVDDPNHHP
jgi:predicted nucleic acid-binding protein